MQRKASLLVFLCRGAAYLGEAKCKPSAKKSKLACFSLPRCRLSWRSKVQTECKETGTCLFFFAEVPLILAKQSANRVQRNGDLLVFLCRGAAYLGEAKCKPSAKKRGLACFSFIGVSPTATASPLKIETSGLLVGNKAF
ncbi:MAG: hypothetical protein IKR63_03515 [Alloprevotella sp.]|nr:hypothetical protein [Alloprevotella sp.]